MKQLVSIIIPVYNAERWIRGAIESALMQTWPAKEVIIVDDGSTDATRNIARSYASGRVALVTQEHKGASAARNLGLSMAQGDYIQWLDADDVLAPDKIEIQLNGAEPGRMSRILLSGSWGKFYHLPENCKFTPDALWESLEPVEWLYRKIHGNLWMAIESWLVSRKLTELSGLWNEGMSLDDDGEYFCRILSNAVRVRFVPESRSFCRRVTFGISHSLTLNDRKLNSLFISLRAHIKVMQSMEDSPRVRAACLKLLDRCAIDFYPERPDLFEQIQMLAKGLGGHLADPELRAKYRWLQMLFGWKAAKKTQNALPAFKAVGAYALERFSSSFRTKKRKLDATMKAPGVTGLFI